VIKFLGRITAPPTFLRTWEGLDHVTSANYYRISCRWHDSCICDMHDMLAYVVVTYRTWCKSVYAQSHHEEIKPISKYRSCKGKFDRAPV